MQEVKANEKLLRWAEGKTLADILKRVNQFINMAEGSNHNVPDSPEWHALNEEQNRARENADALMDAYRISEAMREAAKPATERIKPVMDTFEGGSGDLESYIDRLANLIAQFTHVSIRKYASYDREQHVWMHRVFGYESDVRYFLFLYTTLRLHFIGALRPELDPSLNFQQNLFILHNAGFSWKEIGKMYGWTTRNFNSFGEEVFYDVKDEPGTYEVWYQPDGKRWEGETRLAFRPFRLAYEKECKVQGVEPIKNIRPEAFRQDAAQGYLDRIRRRLREVEEKRRLEGGSALAVRTADLEQFIRECMGGCTKCPACGMLSLFDYRCDVCGNTEGMPGIPPAPLEECPRCKKAKSGVCNEHRTSWGRTHYRKFSEAGYNAGVRQANSADLGGQRTGSSTTKSIN